MNSGFGVSGKLTMIHRDKNNRIVSKNTIDNLITNAGLVHIANMIIGLDASGASHIQIGTGGSVGGMTGDVVPPRSTDIALNSYYAEGVATRELKVVAENGIPGTANYTPFHVIISFGYTFTFDGYVKINEAGIFSGSRFAAPTIISRKTFADREMNALETLEIVWELSVSRYPK